MRLCVLIAVLGLAAPDLARAAEVDDLIDAGLTLREQGRDREALDKFKAAYALDRSGRARAQIALAYQALGDWLRAQRQLAVALRGDDPWVAKNKGILQEALQTIEGHLGRVAVTVNVSRAQIRLNGQRARPRRPAFVATGSVKLEVQADGHWPERRTLEVGAGQLVRPVVQLKPKSDESPPRSATGATPSDFPEAPPAADARSSVAGEGASRARPDATSGSARPDAASGSARPDAVSGSARPDAVSGSARPDAASGSARPDAVSGLSAAAHAPARPTASVTAKAPAGRTLTIGEWFGWGLAGGAALGLGAGVTGIIIRNQHIDAYNDPSCVTVERTRDENCGAELDAANSAETLATVGFVAGGGLALGSLLVFLLSGDDVDDPTTAAWQCGRGPGTVGTSCVVRF